MKKMHIFLFAALLSAVAMPAPGAAVLTDGLVSYWQLDEISGTNAEDMQGNSNGTALGGTTVGIPGKISTAYDFDGVDDRVNITNGDMNSRNFSTSNMTIALWINKSTNQTADRFLLGRDSGPLQLGSIGNIPRVAARHSNGTFLLIPGTTSMAVGTFYFVVATYNHSKISLWVNGVEEASYPYTGNFLDPLNPWSIGGVANDASQATDGIIDEVGFWNRSLNSTEIAQLYNAGTGIPYPFGSVTDAVNITAINANGTILERFNLFATNGTHNTSISSGINPRLVGYDILPQGIINITISGQPNDFDDETQTFQINSTMGIVNATFTLYRIQQFQAINADTNTTISIFNILINNTVNATSYFESTTNGIVQISLRDLISVLGDVSIRWRADGFNDTYQDVSLNLSSVLNLTASMEPTTFRLRAFDEQATTTMLTFNATLANSSNTSAYTNQTDLNLSFGAFPIGEVTITMIDYDGLYQQRQYFLTLTANAIVDFKAYLLKVGFGQLVRFTVQDQSGDRIQGALCTAQKLIDSVFTTVAQGETDSTGVCTLFLSPIDSYQFVFTADGFDAFTTTLTPSNTDYTITLGGQSEIDFETALSNVNYAMLPDTTNRLNRSATSNINFSVFAISNDLDWFSLNVSINGTQLYFNNVTTAMLGGTIVAIFNTTEYELGTLVNAYGLFKKEGFGTFPVNRTYILANTNYNQTTIAAAVDEINAAGPDCSLMCRMWVVIIVAGSVGAAIAAATRDTRAIVVAIGLTIVAFGAIEFIPRIVAILIGLLIIGVAVI